MPDKNQRAVIWSAKTNKVILTRPTVPSGKERGLLCRKAVGNRTCIQAGSKAAKLWDTNKKNTWQVHEFAADILRSYFPKNVSRKLNSHLPQLVYCHMTDDGKGWTLITRFPDSDGKNWVKDTGFRWYDRQVAMGITTDPSKNGEMISTAFWLVSGTKVKIMRSDKPSLTFLTDHR